MHKKGFKAKEKMVPELDFNAVRQDKTKLLAEYAGDLSQDLHDADAFQKLVKCNRPENPQLQPGGPKNRQIKTTVDIAKGIDVIDAEFKELRARRHAMLDEKYNVENLGKRLRSEVDKFKALNESLNQELTVGKDQVALLEESKSKLFKTIKTQHEQIKEVTNKIKQQQKQLIELKTMEAKFNERLRSRDMQDVKSKIEKHHQEKKAALDWIANAKGQLAELNAEFAPLENELETKTAARDELQAKLTACVAEKTALSQQLKKDCAEIENLDNSAAETRKFLNEKEAQNLALELELLDVTNKVKETAARKEKEEEKLEKVAEELKVSEVEFVKMESLLRETQEGAKVMQAAIADKRKKKSEQVKLMDALVSDTAMLDKKVSIDQVHSTFIF